MKKQILLLSLIGVLCTSCVEKDFVIAIEIPLGKEFEDFQIVLLLDGEQVHQEVLASSNIIPPS